MVNVHVTGRNIIFSVIRRCSTSTQKFVPTARGVSRAQIEEFCEFVDRGRNILVLTGAGISTESGIPDYRSQGVGELNSYNLLNVFKYKLSYKSPDQKLH